jgi:hypothetical protein
MSARTSKWIGRGAACIPLLLFLLSPLCAQQQQIDRLGWLAGSWQGIEDEGSEEHWTAPGGGILLGLHRDTKGDRVFFEYLRIEQRGDSVFYVASPMARKETAFLLVASDSGFARFENPEHDYPVRIEYELTGEEEITARISGVNGRDLREWVFRRRKSGLQ